VLPVIDYFRTELGHTYPLPELRRWVYGAVLAPSTAVLDIASAASVQHFANVRPHILDDGEPDVTVPSQPEAASTKHPYVSRAPRSYWKRAVGSRSVATLDDVWTPPDIAPGDRIVTAGSCFAQHIGSRLLARDATVLDVEPAPESIRDPNVARRHGYGLFSARYGNIYSSRQMVLLLDEAFGERSPVDAVWRRGARYFDALRPTVEPDGHDSADAVREARAVHLAKVRELFELMDVFVFTLGLTEIWESIEDETAYPTAPGTVCGEFDPARYRFRNLTWPEVAKDLTLLFRRLMQINPRFKMILTVSPVPMVATATNEHVLVANMYSKSTLRAAAAELATRRANVTYFPSYELISSHPAGHQFFEPDLRHVLPAGVDYVMRHFFTSHLAERFPLRATQDTTTSVGPICDEDRLDARIDYTPGTRG
jgi:hypothetical protein